MGTIAALAVREPVRVDARRVGDMVRELGETGAERVIRLALDQMRRLLGELQQAAQNGEGAALCGLADQLSRLAWQVGLVSLAGVAVDVADCAERGDEVALQATLARVLRVGARSLEAIDTGVG